MKPYARKKRLKIRTRPKPKENTNEPVQVQVRVDVGNSNNLPKQSSHTTRILFETIAPHVETRTLQHLTKQLSRIVSRGHHKLDSQDRDGKKATLKRRLDMLFGVSRNNNGGGTKEDSEIPEKESVVNYSWGLKAHPWIQHTIYTYFMGKLLDKPYKERADDNPLTYLEDPTFPLNQNRLHYEKHLNILIEARKISLRHPIFWTDKAMRESGYSFNLNSQDNGRWEVKQKLEKQERYQNALLKQHSHKSDAELQSEAEELLEMLMSHLPPRHFHKIMGTLEGYVKLDDTIASSSASLESEGVVVNDSNGWCIDEDDGDESVSPLPLLPESRTAHADWKKHRIPVLGKFLGNCSPSHSHLIAVDLGRFFYMELPKPVALKKQGKIRAVAPDERKVASFAITKQWKLQSIEKRYQSTQSEFVQTMMDLQHQFAYWERAGTEEGGLNSVSHSHDVSEGNISEDDDVTSDLMVGELKTSLKREQVEELAETMVELRRMGLRSDEDEMGNKKTRGRPKEDTHLYFTAIGMEGEGETSDSVTKSSLHTTATADEAELEERIVFINNLPIDTTEEEIDQIYSRCGPLDSIQLFNLRPDLDPGPLTKNQLQERRRKNKLRNKNLFTPYSKNDNKRPRTPVYGMLRFQTAKGYGVATSPELCIFGCVIRRHPVMSIKHQDLTTMYLEQLPSNLNSMDVEYKLARLLRSHNVHVMLDGMQGVGTNGSGIIDSVINGDYQEYSKPSSCQVKFEDFHTASQAYQWIKEGNDVGENEGAGNSVAVMGSEECQLHWFRTPENSMGYWTRELNF